MKKLLAICLCFVLTFVFAACGDRDKYEEVVDVEYYANIGQMPETDYAIGAKIATVKSELEAAAEQSEDVGYYCNEGFEYTIIGDGNFSYCYENEKENEGITTIVSFGETYGFAHGESLTRVKEVMEALEITAEEREPESGELFFLPVSSNPSVLQCDFEKYTILFVFEENSLCAGAISAK